MRSAGALRIALAGHVAPAAKAGRRRLVSGTRTNDVRGADVDRDHGRAAHRSGVKVAAVAPMVAAGSQGRGSLSFTPFGGALIPGLRHSRGWACWAGVPRPIPAPWRGVASKASVVGALLTPCEAR